MSNDRKFPWLNVWMIAFGALGIWAYVAWYSRSRGEWIEWLWLAPSMSIPLLILLVGLLRFPRSSSESAAESERLTLADLGGIYLGALHRIGRHKWILAVFGVIALAAFAGVLTHYSRELQFRKDNPELVARAMSHRESHVRIPIGISAWQAFSGAVPEAFRSFLPGTRIRPGGITFLPMAFLFLLGVILSDRKLKALASQRDYSGEATFARAILLPVAIACLATAVFRTKMMISLAAQTASQQMAPGTFGGKRTEVWLGIFEQHLFVAVLAGLAVAGLAGSLLRMERNESITRDSFFRDTIRYFKPVLGVYLLLEVTFFLLTLSSRGISFTGIHRMAALLLILAPYVAIRQDFGMWRAIRQSFSGLRRNAWNAISFIALGLAFISLVYTVTIATSLGVRFSDYWLIRGLMSAALTLGAHVLVATVMVIAIWDFYARISERERESARV